MKRKFTTAQALEAVLDSNAESDAESFVADEDSEIDPFSSESEVSIQLITSRRKYLVIHITQPHYMYMHNH
jgi:hypothetical protein